MTQGIIAAGNDYYTAKLASKLFGDEEHFRAAVSRAIAKT